MDEGGGGGMGGRLDRLEVRRHRRHYYCSGDVIFFVFLIFGIRWYPRIATHEYLRTAGLVVEKAVGGGGKEGAGSAIGLWCAAITSISSRQVSFFSVRGHPRIAIYE